MFLSLSCALPSSNTHGWLAVGILSWPCAKWQRQHYHLKDALLAQLMVRTQWVLKHLMDHWRIMRFGFEPVTSRKCACECTWLCVWVCMWNRERKRDSVSCILWTPTDLSMGAIMSRSCNVISIRADFLSSPDKGVDTSTPHSEWVDHSNVSYLTHSHALIDGWQPVIVSW